MGGGGTILGDEPSWVAEDAIKNEQRRSASANDRQIGGDHYKRDGALEHWDLIERSGIGYLEGCATKYVARWRQKGGIQDLQKAEHYVQKLIELYDEGIRLPRGVARMDLVSQFCAPLEVVERSIINMLCRWDCRAHLIAAQSDLRHLIIVEQRIAANKENAA